MYAKIKKKFVTLSAALVMVFIKIFKKITLKIWNKFLENFKNLKINFINFRRGFIKKKKKNCKNISKRFWMYFKEITMNFSENFKQIS